MISNRNTQKNGGKTKSLAVLPNSGKIGHEHNFILICHRIYKLIKYSIICLDIKMCISF